MFVKNCLVVKYYANSDISLHHRIADDITFFDVVGAQLRTRELCASNSDITAHLARGARPDTVVTATSLSPPMICAMIHQEQ